MSSYNSQSPVGQSPEPQESEQPPPPQTPNIISQGSKSATRLCQELRVTWARSIPCPRIHSLVWCDQMEKATQDNTENK